MYRNYIVCKETAVDLITHLSEGTVIFATANAMQPLWMQFIPKKIC